MSGPIVATFLLVILMTSQCPCSSGLPRISTRRLAKTYSKNFSKDVCMNYMEMCVPWETKCCNGMSCLNLARGFCLYPLEECFCQKTYDTY